MAERSGRFLAQLDRVRRSRALALCAVALICTACAGPARPSSTPSQSPGATSPLAELFAPLWGQAPQAGTAEYQAEVAAKQQVVDQLVAQCMAEQGFEYYPSQPEVSVALGNDGGEGPQYGTLEYARLYGYGMVTSPELENEVPADGTSQADEYRMSMTQAQRNAYDAALYGQRPSLEPETDGEEVAPASAVGGCMGDAQTRVFGDFESPESPFAGLLADLNSAVMAIRDDPRALAIDAQWAQCMADGGFPDLANPHDAQALVSTKITDAFVHASGTDDTASEMQLFEVAVATADYSCRDQVGYERRLLELRNEVEELFIAANRPELEAWLAYELELKSQREADLATLLADS